MRTAKDMSRPAMRPEIRTDESDSLERARKRTAELLGNIEAIEEEGVNRFATPPAPDGWTYEWKMKSVNGWQDPSYMSKMRRSGWEPVDASRHPEMMDQTHTGAIERDGMVLCERPQEVTDQIKARDMRMARQQVKIKESQLSSTDGLLGREDSRVRPKINKSYEPMQIPD